MKKANLSTVVSVIALSTALFSASVSTFAAPPDHAPAWGHRAQEHSHQKRYYQQHRDSDNNSESREPGDKHHRYHSGESRPVVINRQVIIKQPDRVRHYRRGDRIERVYLNDRYYVNDWRERRLATPPNGYRWVNANGQYLLVAIASGIIANIILNH